MITIVALLAVAQASAPVTEETLHDRIMKAAERGLSVSVDDGMFSGAVGLVLRPRLRIPFDGAYPQFSMSMIRPQIRASLWQNRIKIFVQPELADTARILDAEVTFRPWKFLGVRAGRFVTAFTRSFYTPVPRLKFMDFSASNVFFRVDRDVGGSLLGEAGVFDYEVSVVTGQSTVPNTNDKSRFLALARLNAQVVGKVAYDENRCSVLGCELGLSIGANANYHRYEVRAADPANVGATIGQGDEQRFTAGIDAALTAGYFQLQAEAYYRGTHTPNQGPRIDAYGGYAHASYGVIPHFMEVGVRGDVLETSVTATGHAAMQWGFDAQAVGYFLGEHAKLWLEYQYRDTYGQTAAHALVMQTQIWL